MAKYIGQDDILKVVSNPMADEPQPTGGPDNLSGDNGNNSLSGLGGNDTLNGNGGHDFLSGDAGADVLFGGSGNDTINGGTGDDKLYGDLGHDIIYGADGSDTIWGGDGNDIISGGWTGDGDGGIGRNTLYGEAGNDTIYASEGGDLLSGHDGHDSLNGGAGADSISGDEGNDVVWGGSGDDVIYGQSGSDTIDGHDGNDWISAGWSGDSDGGMGFNRVYAGAGDDTVYAGEGGDEIFGMDGDDSVGGGGGRDTIFADSGNDSVWGGADNDSIHGGSGADSIDGADGNDWISGGGSGDQDNGTGSNTLFGGSGNDTLYAGDGGDELHGNDDDDDIYGGRGDDSINGGKGEDIIYYTGGNDTINGGGGEDFLAIDFGTKDATIRVISYGSGDLNFAETQFVINLRTETGVQRLYVNDIEEIDFSWGINNPVTLTSGSIAIEMLRLADEVYGPQMTLSHGAEPLAYELGHVYEWSEGVSEYAQSAGWHAVSALEMGIKPADYSEGVARYSFVNGVYQAQEWVQLFSIAPEANAMVLVGLVNGIPTLSVTFRGTDQKSDFVHFVDFGNHYSLFAPLVGGIKAYFAEHTEIQTVLVSGHSLGAAMATLFATDIQGLVSNIDVYTMGSPGTLSFPSADIMNLVHTDDTVTFAPKPLAGTEIYIDSDVSPGLISGLDEHSANLYVQSALKLHSWAFDGASLFYHSDLALSLRSNQPYTGNDIRVALGRPSLIADTAPGDTERGPYNDSRYSTQYTGVISSDSNSHFVLANNAQDDIILFQRLSSSYFSTTTRIDGGTGRDMLGLNGRSTDYTLTYSAVDGTTLLEYGLFSVDIAITKSVERFVFSDRVLNYDGTVINGQRPTGAANGATVFNAATLFTLSDAFEFADAGNGDMSVVGTNNANILYIGDGNKIVALGEGNDIVYVNGLGTANVLEIDGGAGADLIVGGSGTETYRVDNVGDIVVVESTIGYQTVISQVDFVLGVNIEELRFTGGTSGSGNAIANVIIGNTGDNVLDGRQGADSMTGGAGNDTYFVDHVGDLTLEGFNGGTDTVKSSVSFTLQSGVEHLLLLETASINGAGNNLNNTLTGNSGDNSLSGLDGNDILDGLGGVDTMIGGLGNDTYYVDNASDRVTEAADGGTDTVFSSLSVSLATQAVENITLIGSADADITANPLDNILTGNSGNNSLNGRSGADRMIGGLGNDTYYIENLLDRVTETADQGTDTVFSSISFSVAAQAVENITLTGSADIEAIGNSLANILTGNTGNNSLNGRVGADTMIGGGGSDIYYVDNLGDVVTELAGQGVDTIVTSLSYSLAGLFVEKLTLNGSAGNNATGNQFNNILTGNSGNNSIDGGAGADRMYGGLGDDTFIIDDINDKPTEKAGEGYDTLMTGITFSVAAQAIEAIILTGSDHIDMVANPLDNVITGNSGRNVINGRSGNDTIDGGAGNDTLVGSTGNDVLTGGLGADIFLFSKKPGVDTITDFDKAEGDTLNLNEITAGIANTSIFTQSGSDVIIDFGGGHILTIEDASRADVLTQIVW